MQFTGCRLWLSGLRHGRALVNTTKTRSDIVAYVKTYGCIMATSTERRHDICREKVLLVEDVVTFTCLP